MLSSARRNKTLIICVVGVLLILISLVKATANVNKYKKNFQEEMADRLDLEEKLDKMEKERAVLLSDLKNLKEELKEKNDALKEIKDKLSQEEDKNASLQGALEKARPGQKNP
jgi:septal ring factor EnvC (AmiA/AmiB activator)